LPYFDEQVHLPDFRIEYEMDGCERHENVEVLTPHYRGAHLSGRAKCGFRWRIRVLLPARLRKAKALHRFAFLDQVVRTIDPWTIDRLETFFKACRKTGAHISRPEDPEVAKAYRRFGAIRVPALYRTWLRLGDHTTLRSPVGT
jgi:hypothetical protein